MLLGYSSRWVETPPSSLAAGVATVSRPTWAGDVSVGETAAPPAGTRTAWPQPGQRTFLPASSSLTFSRLPQPAQLQTIIGEPRTKEVRRLRSDGIRNLIVFVFLEHRREFGGFVL